MINENKMNRWNQEIKKARKYNKVHCNERERERNRKYKVERDEN